MNEREFTRRYLTDMGVIPAEHHDFFLHLNQVRMRAYHHPGRVFKAHAGSYYTYRNGQLIAIDHQRNEDTGERYWLAYEDSAHRDWYSDPYRTMTDLLTALE